MSNITTSEHLPNGPESARLIFRPLRQDDEKVLFPHIDDELTQYWIGWEASPGIEEERARIEQMISADANGHNAHFLAFSSTEEFVGFCALVQVEDWHETKEREIDLWVRKEVQGQGYATEMVQAIIEWARNSTDLPYLVYSVTEGNTRSIGIADRLGLEGLRTYQAKKRGVDRSVTDYKIPLR